MSAMITVNVELGERAYPIHIGADLIGRTELFAPHIAGSSVAIVTNSTIDPLYGETLRAALAPLLELPVEMVLVSHGDPVLRDGAAAIERALAAAA